VERSGPVLRDLNLGSRDEYERLLSLIPEDVGYGRRGLLVLCKTQKALAEEAHVVADAERLGLAAELLDAEGVAARETGIATDVAGGVYFSDDAHLSPPAFMRGLRARIVEMGGEIRQQTSVIAIERDGEQARAARTANDSVDGDLFVLSAGAWSTGVARTLGLRLPMLAGRGYGFTVPQPPESPQIPTILTEARVAVTPMLDGLRFVGTMELGPPQEVVNRSRVQGMIAAIPRYYPAFASAQLGQLPVWSGLRPCSPDGLPYIGRVDGTSNAIVATGHAMMGMSLGPITGKLVAQIAAGEAPSVAIDALSPNRYA